MPEADLPADARANSDQPGLGVIAVLVVIAMLTTHYRALSWNDLSRLAATQSVVERGTLQIDQSSLADSTHDKVYIGGHFYSDKPILPSLVAAAVYFPLYHIGVELEPGPNLAVYLVTLLSMKTLWIAGLIAFYGTLAYTGLSHRQRLLMMFVLALASLHLTWSSVFNNHSFAGSSLILGLYFLLRAKHEARPRIYLFLSGLFFSFAAAADQPTAVFFAGFLLYLLLDAKLRKSVGWYLASLLLTMVPALAINYAISGSIMPLQINPEHFRYPDSPWVVEELSGVKSNTGWSFFRYIGLLLLGRSGFLWHNPLLILAIPLLLLTLIRRMPLGREALVIGIGSLIILVYYATATTDQLGGWSFSIRWFVPLLPIMYLYLYPLFQGRSSLRTGWVVNSFVAVSFVIACIGLINPWTNKRLSSVPVLSNIRYLMQSFD